MRKHFLFALMVLMMIGINVNVADAARPPKNGNQRQDEQKSYLGFNSAASEGYVMAYAANQVIETGNPWDGEYVVVAIFGDDEYLAQYVPGIKAKPGELPHIRAICF